MCCASLWDARTLAFGTGRRAYAKLQLRVVIRLLDCRQYGYFADRNAQWRMVRGEDSQLQAGITSIYWWRYWIGGAIGLLISCHYLVVVLLDWWCYWIIGVTAHIFQ